MRLNSAKKKFLFFLISILYTFETVKHTQNETRYSYSAVRKWSKIYSVKLKTQPTLSQFHSARVNKYVYIPLWRPKIFLWLSLILFFSVDSIRKNIYLCGVQYLQKIKLPRSVVGTTKACVQNVYTWEYFDKFLCWRFWSYWEWKDGYISKKFVFMELYSWFSWWSVD